MRNLTHKLLKFDDGNEKFFNLTNDSLEYTNLLETTMSATDIINYNYLCNEMNNLVGLGNFCNTTIGAAEVDNLKQNIYPNPFTKTINSDKNNIIQHTVLYNIMGHLIYNGNNIQNEDFTALPNGIYFLQINDHITTYKLIKQ